ncbi:putative metal-binding motif-containing protein [Sorangium sp. So ce861]|uniref:putative metal-binding motif-containing protein n=1 Tax=Sorangium sp. So ce861 TaxID=3133323 RepID=UPI003F608278
MAATKRDQLRARGLLCLPCLLLGSTDAGCVDEAARDGASAEVTSDADDDGVSFPADCHDGDPAVLPGAAEVCDGIDNDCDDVLDEGCDLEPPGRWAVSPAVQFDCPSVPGELDFDTIFIEEDELGFVFGFQGPRYGASTRLYGARQGLDFSGSMSQANISCSWDYEVSGSFLGPFDFEATLSFIPSEDAPCGCTERHWRLSGAR